MAALKDGHDEAHGKLRSEAAVLTASAKEARKAALAKVREAEKLAAELAKHGSAKEQRDALLEEQRLQLAADKDAKHALEDQALAAKEVAKEKAQCQAELDALKDNKPPAGTQEDLDAAAKAGEELLAQIKAAKAELAAVPECPEPEQPEP